jgi:5-(carboxyamino)imidazole ribonucleotide mutase
MARHKKLLAGIVMGSDSDWPTLQPASEVLKEFSLAHEVRVVSAHRTPRDMARYASTAASRGLKVIIAGAGGAAHLPGMIASHTPLPVIGVPVETGALRGLDSLLSIVQMPAGVPVAAVGIGNGRNAGLLAVRLLATGDPTLLREMAAYQRKMADESRQKDRKIMQETAE